MIHTVCIYAYMYDRNIPISNGIHHLGSQSLFTHAHLERTQFGSSSGFAWFPVHISVHGLSGWDAMKTMFQEEIPVIQILQFLPVSSLMLLCWAYAQKRQSTTSINFMDGYDPNQQSRIQYMGESHPAWDPWYVQKCVFKNQQTMRCLPFTTCHIIHSIHYDMLFHYTHMIAFIHFVIYF